MIHARRQCRGSEFLLPLFIVMVLAAPALTLAQDSNWSSYAAADRIDSVFQASASPASGRGYSDDELHFVASFACGALATQLSTYLVPEQHQAWAVPLVGTGLGLLPGIAKELYDMRQPGNEFSGRDLAFDALGSAAGAMTTWAIHAIVGRGRHRRISP